MNKVYKVIFNKSLNLWMAVSELAKGRIKYSIGAQHDQKKAYSTNKYHQILKSIPSLSVLCLSILAYHNTYAMTSEQCTSNCVMVSNSAELVAALASGSATTILMTNDISLDKNINVNQISTGRQNIVLDGGGHTLNMTYGNGTDSYKFIFTGQNSSEWSDSGSFTFENFNHLVAGTGESKTFVSLDGGTGTSASNINIVFNNIDRISDSMIANMGAIGNGGKPNQNSELTFGNFNDNISFSMGTNHQLAQANKINFDGQLTIEPNSKSGSGVYAVAFWTNGEVADSVMHFTENADVKITTPSFTGGYRSNNYQYILDDGAKFTLYSDQNVFGNANNGLHIGTYNKDEEKFGTGVRLILANKDQGAYSSGNAISNIGGAINGGMGNGPSNSGDVIFNLAEGSNLNMSGTSTNGILVQKTGTGSGGVYVRSNGAITAGTGISVTHAGNSGDIIIENGENGLINAAIGMSVTQTNTANNDQFKIRNAGIINSSKEGIAVTAHDNKVVTIDNTYGQINASSGVAVHVGDATTLNLKGGEISTTGNATSVVFGTNTGNNIQTHLIDETVFNVNGSGGAFNTSNQTIQLNHVTFNTENSTVLSKVDQLVFVDQNDPSKRSSIHISGTGIGISDSTQNISRADLAGLDINVNGAGTGINITDGGIDLSNQVFNIHVNNSEGTAFAINDGIENITTVGSNYLIDATAATAIVFKGNAGKTLNNQGEIRGDVVFEGNANHFIHNDGILNGALTTGNGDDTLVLGGTSQSHGNIHLGDGNNNITIQGGAKVENITTGSGNDIFTLENMTEGSTYLGILDAGSGQNTLNIKNSIDSFFAETEVVNFDQVNLNHSQLTLVAETNIGSGQVTIDQDSQLIFGQDFKGIFNANLGHTVQNDGSVIVNHQANVILGQENSTFAGDWKIQSGGTLSTTSGDHLGTNSTVTVDGTLNIGNLNTFDHALTGTGLLAIANSNQAFNFGQNVGADFTGTVDLKDAIFALTDSNVTALSNATLQLSEGSSTVVGTQDREITGLTFNGGSLSLNGSIAELKTEGTLNVHDLTLGQGNVNLILDHQELVPNTAEGYYGLALLEQDKGQVLLELVSADQSVTGNVNDLTLTINGQTSHQNIVSNLFQNEVNVADAIYSFGLDTNDQKGLYATYGLTELNLLADDENALLLQTTNIENSNKVLNAKITGDGGLNINASQGALTLANGNNTYTGKTTVTEGELVVGADHALGNTSLLDINENASVNMNGKTQTIGALNNLGNLALGTNGHLTINNTFTNNHVINLNGGILNLNAGGVSTQINGLMGDGALNVNGGVLTLAQDNTEFNGSTTIAENATTILETTLALGTGTITNDGQIEFNGAQGILGNDLLGEKGHVTLTNQANIVLAGNNIEYSGSFTNNAGSVLEATNAQNLGKSTVVNEGDFIFNNHSFWNLANTMTGSGHVIKNGEGTLKLNDHLFQATSTTINAGAIQLGGSDLSQLTSNVMINHDGTLGGAGVVNGNVTNYGHIQMASHFTGGTFGTLKIDGDYIGLGGLLTFGTALSGDDSATDQLKITGNTSGNSFVAVHNIGGLGAKTVEGIKLIDIEGESAGQFELAGRVVAGAYEYYLYQGGVSTPEDGNWYLRTKNNERRPESASYIANIAAANTMFISDLTERRGSTQYLDPMTGKMKTTTVWLTNKGSRLHFNDDSGTLKTTENRYVLQLGADVIQGTTNNQDLWRIGAMTGYAHSGSKSNSKVTGYRSEGTVDGYNIGVYGSWFEDAQDKSGAYVDSWLQYSWFKNKVSGQDIAQESYHAKGVTASIESGYAFKVAETAHQHYFIQPKAQSIWMNVKADDRLESNGTYVQDRGHGNVQTRLGVKAFANIYGDVNQTNSDVFTPFVELNWIHNTREFSTQLDTDLVTQNGAKNIVEAKVGANGKLNEQFSLWGSLDQLFGQENYRNTSLVIGAKYEF